MKKNLLKIISLAVCFLALVQCDGDQKRNKVHTAMTAYERDEQRNPDKFFGDPIFTTKKKKAESGQGIGVNAYLWRASLDTFSFMPLQKAEPLGGVIMTEWHTPPNTTDERVKANILILDRELRSDGVRVSLFHQVHDAKKGWVDVEIAPETIEELERTILTRARQLKYKSNS